MRKAVLLALLLTGCGQSMSSINQECGTASRQFVDYWPCQRQALVTKGAGPADLKRGYAATGDLVYERVKSGQMTDVEAKYAMSRAETDANNTIYQRYGATGDANPATYQPVGGGTVVRY